jgi:hypothetical protein
MGHPRCGEGQEKKEAWATRHSITESDTVREKPYHLSTMFDWIAYCVFGLAVIYLLGAVSWWIFLAVKSWRKSRRSLAVFIVLLPSAVLAFLFWFVNELFGPGLALSVIASQAHIVITLWRRSHRRTALVLVLAAAGFILAPAIVIIPMLRESPKFEAGVPKDVTRMPDPVYRPPLIPAVVKQDCQRLVEGQLVFAPGPIMRQGKPDVVSARLTRGTDTQITSGFDGKTITIENTQVSCMVSMALDSQETSAFKIENIPSGRKDEQILLANTYTQWDWRVTPLKSGTLHLLLYVTPMLYVDGVGQGLKQFPQPARVITVSPDYLFTVENFVFGNWTVWGTLLTVIIVPFFLWVRGRLKERREKKDLANKAVGFGKS